jgi:hypothetical protein
MKFLLLHHKEVEFGNRKYGSESDLTTHHSLVDLSRAF